MASSSSFLIVSVALVLQFLLIISASASTSPKYIESICKNVQKVTKSKPFCLKTLKAYPPMFKATNKFKAANATFDLIMPYAEKFAAFAEKAATRNPKLKEDFIGCQDAYSRIIANLRSAAMELEESPETANYDILVSYDQTAIVRTLLGKNKDKDSKTVVRTTLMMNRLIDIALAATVSVGG